MSSREGVQHDLEEWRRERETVESEMARLIASLATASKEERDVRRAQFMALIERREAAARKILPVNYVSQRIKLAGARKRTRR